MRSCRSPFNRRRIRPATLPPIHAGAPAAGTCCRSDQSPGAGPGSPQPSRRVLPILPAPARAGSPQDVRSAARTPGAQLPEPSITGTRPGSDRPRCRRSTPELPQPVPAAAQIRAQERAQEARSHPGGCCPSSRPRPALEAPQDVRSAARMHRPALPEPSITGTRRRIRPATLPPIRAGAPAAGTCCRSDQSPGKQKRPFFTGKAVFVIMPVLLPFSRFLLKGGVSMIVSFILSILANIYSHYICKWLDGKK